MMRFKTFNAYLVTLLLLGVTLSAQAQSTAISSWNMEWLTSDPDAPATRGKRNEQDFHALATHFSRLNSDVIAFQEVDSAQAMQRITGNNYQIVMSDRSQRKHRAYQFSDTNQYTGFAIRQGISFADPSDVDLLPGQHHKLRFAAYLVLYPDSDRPLHMLNVHLKAGCAGKFHASNRNCQRVRQQGQMLNQWLKTRARLNQNYLILGDFNHNLTYSGDWLWQEVTSGLPQPPVLATRNTQPNCKVRSRKQPDKLHQFRSLVDHIVVSPNLRTSATQQVTFTPQQVLSYKLSDHCPLRTRLTQSTSLTPVS